MLKQEVNLVDLVAHIAGERVIKLEGHRMIAVDFVIGRKSDGYDDRDSLPGGIPFVSGAVITWGKVA